MIATSEGSLSVALISDLLTVFGVVGVDSGDGDSLHELSVVSESWRLLVSSLMEAQLVSLRRLLRWIFGGCWLELWWRIG